MSRPTYLQAVPVAAIDDHSFSTTTQGDKLYLSEKDSAGSEAIVAGPFMNSDEAEIAALARKVQDAIDERDWRRVQRLAFRLTMQAVSYLELLWKVKPRHPRPVL